MFELPKEYRELVDQALTAKVGPLNLRFRLPTARDTAFAASMVESGAAGKVSFETGYIVALMASSLIGINGKSMADMCTDASKKDLFARPVMELSDDEYAEMAKAKMSIIGGIPGELVMVAYRDQIAPWMLKTAGEVTDKIDLDKQVLLLLEALQSGA